MGAHWKFVLPVKHYHQLVKIGGGLFQSFQLHLMAFFRWWILLGFVMEEARLLSHDLSMKLLSAEQTGFIEEDCEMQF